MPMSSPQMTRMLGFPLGTGVLLKLEPPFRIELGRTALAITRSPPRICPDALLRLRGRYRPAERRKGENPVLAPAAPISGKSPMEPATCGALVEPRRFADGRLVQNRCVVRRADAGVARRP